MTRSTVWKRVVNPWCLRVELNHVRRDLQTRALPDELQRHMGWDIRVELILTEPQSVVLPLHQSHHMEAKIGVEPMLTILQTAVLPLDYFALARALGI